MSEGIRSGRYGDSVYVTGRRQICNITFPTSGDRSYVVKVYEDLIWVPTIADRIRKNAARLREMNK